MAEATAQTADQGHQHHPLGVYLKVWGWLFVLSVGSYIVDVSPFPEHLIWVQWTLITLFAIVKATLILQYFMHLKWERLSLVYTIILPVVLILLLVVMVAWEGGYIAGIREFFLGG